MNSGKSWTSVLTLVISIYFEPLVPTTFILCILETVCCGVSSARNVFTYNNEVEVVAVTKQGSSRWLVLVY